MKRSTLDPSFLRRAIAYFRDPDVALWRRLLGVGALAYTVWPLDFIPDVPLVGWLDDIGVVGLVTWFLVREIRRYQPRTKADWVAKQA